MKIFGLIVLLGFLFSCDSSNPNKKDYKLIQNKSLIIAKGIKNIEDTSFYVPKGLLLGKWRESINWISIDSTWTGTQPLKIIHEYEFFPNGKFLQRQINLDDSSIMWTYWGEGYFNDKRSIIFLNYNSKIQLINATF